MCWILGGGATQPGVKERAESFTDQNQAHAFKLDVEFAGLQWPDGWVKGLRYVREVAPARITLNENFHYERWRRATKVARG